jgi:PIN domain nuclease of toxin-antitoxin system
MERNQEPRLTFIDTHIAVWLCSEKRRSFPARARAAIENGWLAISPMVGLELQFLQEIGRIKLGSDGILNTLSGLPLHIDQTPFSAVAQAAATQTWTRDPFDRVIVGQALAAGGWLVTADEKIREHFPRAIWD